MTPALRGTYAHSLHELGKVTLETYLLQHHLWLTSNAKTLLRLIPQEDWRACNMLLTTTLYFLASRELYRLTMSLRGMLLPDKSAADCVKNLCGLAAALAAACVVGWAVKAAAVGADRSGAGPGAAAPLVVFLGGGLGAALAAWLVKTRNHTYKAERAGDDDGGGGGDGSGRPSLFVEASPPERTGKAAAGAVAAGLVLAYGLAAVYFGERPGDPAEEAAAHLVGGGFDPKAAAAAAAAAKPLAHRVPGEMGQPLMGLGVLVLSLVMLGSMDSYFGIPMLALKLLGGGGRGAEVTYAAAYQPLLDSLGVGPALPTGAAPAAASTVPAGGAAGGGDGDEAAEPLLSADEG